MILDPKTGEVLSLLPIIRNPYTRVRVQYQTLGESKTHQSHREAVDVNNIIARYERTGQLPPARVAPQYADVTGLQGDLTDLHNHSRATLDVADDFFKKRANEAAQLKDKPEAPKAVDKENG